MYSDVVEKSLIFHENGVNDVYLRKELENIHSFNMSNWYLIRTSNAIMKGKFKVSICLTYFLMLENSLIENEVH